MSWAQSQLYNGLYIITVGVIIHSLFKRYVSYRRLSHIKGPWLAGWSNLWLVGVIWRQQSHLEMHKVSKKYGRFARIGPNDIITTDVDLIHRMQAVRSPYVRSNWYQGFRLAPGLDNVLSMTDDKMHTKRRAQMAMGFSSKGNIDIESTIDRHIVNFLSLIRRKYISSSAAHRPMDLAIKVQYLTLDIIVDIATGAPFEDLVYDEDRHEYLQSTTSSLPAISMVASVPWAGKILRHPWMAKLVSPSGMEATGIGKVIGIATEMVTKRFAQQAEKKEEKPDMLGSFIKHGISQRESIFESIIAILGGSDTMAISIRSTMLYIISNPQVYNNLRIEIDGAVASGKASAPVVKYSETSRLSYLQAVIREGLRIFPPGTGQMPKLSPPGGEMIDGVFIPEGVSVGTNPWFIMRSPENFGQDSDSFKPERWLQATPEEKKRMEYVFELVWAYGKYKCLGQDIAMMELHKVIFELLKNFDWALVDPMNPWQSRNVGIWILRDQNVVITDRLDK